jgi:site-specific DNA-methyltransferase (cytosine-N4-specific)
MMEMPLYETNLGKSYLGDYLQLLEQLKDNAVNLAITSPPFALLRQKEYCNKEQDEYVDWLADFARALKPKLKHDGSFVLDLGGAYQKGRPVRSLYNYKILIRFCEQLGYNLAEEFFWNNPSKLPSPIEWVNKRKIRVKDTVNTVWWFSKSDYPKTNIKNVLVDYSDRMRKLLKDKERFYTPAKRPSGHDISANFHDNGGALPANLLQYPNTESNSKYLRCCKAAGLKGHPARFPVSLPAFFIRFLTDPGDLVLDFFAGSNTTGEAAEMLERRWLAFELNREYLAASCFRFVREEDARGTYEKLLREDKMHIDDGFVAEVTPESARLFQSALFERTAPYEIFAAKGGNPSG